MSESTQTEPQKAEQPTKRQVDALLDEAARRQDSADRLFLLADEAREMARQIGYADGQARGELLLAGYHKSRGNEPDALEAC